MSSPEIALQKALIERLRNDAGVIALVPASNIHDTNARPIVDPSINLGTDQTDDAEYLARDVTIVFHDLHIWKKEAGLAGGKYIAAAITKAVRKARFQTVDGYHFADCHVYRTRFLRDPEGDFSHGIVTVRAITQEVS